MEKPHCMQAVNHHLQSCHNLCTRFMLLLCLGTSGGAPQNKTSLLKATAIYAVAGFDCWLLAVFFVFEYARLGRGDIVAIGECALLRRHTQCNHAGGDAHAFICASSEEVRCNRCRARHFGPPASSSKLLVCCLRSHQYAHAARQRGQDRFSFYGYLQLTGKGAGLKIDESSLTGESLAVSRSSGDQVRPTYVTL